MSENLTLKKEIVAEFIEKYKAAKAVFFVNFKGITVAQDTKLRKSFRTTWRNRL